MYFYLSANTAKDMGITDFASTSGDHDEFSRHWYLHRVILERRRGHLRKRKIKHAKA